MAQHIRHRHKRMLLFYADDVWEHIAGSTKLNALEMEATLGELADIVIIIVESPGTFAELGAFSLSESLRKKLLPIVEKEFQPDASFINTGPLSWINKDSNFSPAIFAQFPHILEESAELLDAKLATLKRSGSELVQDIASSPRHLLYLLADIVAVIGPSPWHHFQFYLNAILGNSMSEDNIRSFLALGHAMKMFKVTELEKTSERFYERLPEHGKLEPFTHREMFDLERQRAQFLSIVQRFDSVTELLGKQEVDKC